jgi:hypothetical protein
VAERLPATARPRATRSQAFLGGSLGLSAVSVAAHNGRHGWCHSVLLDEGLCTDTLNCPKLLDWRSARSCRRA